MFRRCLALFVVIGLVAGQWAAIPHAHGSMSAAEQREHDATPHFHAGWLCTSEHHDEHSHVGHHHSHHERSTQPVADDHDQSEGDSLGSAHAADAIAIPGGVLTCATSSPSEQLLSSWQLVVESSLFDLVADTAQSRYPSLRWHPPDEVLDASSCYLILRNLRI